MPIFKYTVANKDGKKLSGTVEAPDETTAKEELNNLGFSVLSLSISEAKTKLASHLTKFCFDAYDKNSKFVSGTISSTTKEEALSKLKTQYDLNINAIWEEGKSEEEIKTAKSKNLIQQEVLKSDNQEEKIEEKENKEEELFKEKIEYILTQSKKIIESLGQNISPDKQADINQKMDKLLRIKHSKNNEYILETAQILLKTLQEQEKSLAEKGLQDERLQLKMKTKNLLQELKKGPDEKSISDNILKKLHTWDKSTKKKNSAFSRWINRLILKTKDFFTTAPEVQAIEDQIKTYNKQIWELLQLYFKEPTTQYKKKVKTAIKTVWSARKKAKEKLKNVKKEIKAQNALKYPKEENLFSEIITELNTFTGWLLSLYVLYYFIALYLSSKDFGIDEIPQAFYIYESHIFKYILITLFLLHASTALKVNFFRKSLVANICLPVAFFFTTVIALLNF